MNFENGLLNNVGIYKMKSKNKTQQKLLFSALMVLITVIVYQVRNPIVVKKRVGVPVGVPVEVPVQIPV